MPAAGTKGPMQTTGAECDLGGGDPDGGGDNGGGDNGDGDNGGGENPPPGQFSKQPSFVGDMNIGVNYVTNISSGFNSLLNEAWWIKYGIGDIRANTFNLNYHAIAIQENTDKMVSSLDFLSRKSIESSDKFDNNFKSLIDAVNSSGSGSSGGDGSSSGDTAAIKSMMQTAMGWWGGTPGNLSAINSNLTGISNSVAPMFPMLEHFNKQQTSLQTQMAGDLAAIKNALGNDQGSGGSGNEGGTDIDYSKMPGAADNPLRVAESEYNSGLCQEGEYCAFDMNTINKQYDDKKVELQDKYKAIKDEMADVFRFQFSGSAAVPKCFDMFSFAGKSYSICPEVGNYWELLAAVMMFIFYFIALMMLVKR